MGEHLFRLDTNYITTLNGSKTLIITFLNLHLMYWSKLKLTHFVLQDHRYTVCKVLASKVKYNKI